MYSATHESVIVVREKRSVSLVTLYSCISYYFVARLTFKVKGFTAVMESLCVVWHSSPCDFSFRRLNAGFS